MLCKQVLDSSQPRADNFILSQHFHWQTEWGTLPQAKAPIPSVSASSWAAHMSTGLALGQYFPQKGDFPTETFAEVQKTWNLAHPCELLRHFRLPEWVSLERTTLGLLVLLPQCHPRAQCKQPRDFRILAQKGIPVVSGENIDEC